MKLSHKCLMADDDWWQRLGKLAPRPVTDEELERCHTVRSIAAVHQACEQAMMFEHVQLDAVIGPIFFDQEFAVADVREEGCAVNAPLA